MTFTNAAYEGTLNSLETTCSYIYCSSSIIAVVGAATFGIVLLVQSE